MQVSDAELQQLLSALCSAEKVPRTTAEQALASRQFTPGFLTALAAFCVSPQHGDDAMPLRQMGLTLLRRLVADRWKEIPPEDQARLLQSLPASLVVPNKLRGLLFETVASICSHTQSWNEVGLRLRASIAAGVSEEAAASLQCVVVLLQECSPDVAVSLGHLQEPMLALASSEDAPPKILCDAVTAHMAGVNAILCGEGSNSAAAATILQSMPSWLAIHSKLCLGKPGWTDAERVTCAFTALRTMAVFTRPPPLQGVLAESVDSVLRPACLLIQQIEPAYEQAVIFQDDNGQSEEEGGVANLVTQLMELLQSMLPKPKLRGLLKSHVRGMLQLLVPFMRITEAQVRAWRADPNEFLTHEEDDYSRGCAVRLSGEGLVGELLTSAKREALAAVAGIAADLLSKGDQGTTAGQAHAWKLLEVALFLFGCAASEVSAKALQRGELGQLAPTVFAAAGRLCTQQAAPEFLRARAFALLRRLGDAVCALVPADLPMLLEAAAEGLRPANPLTVRVCACRAFCRFLSAVNEAELKSTLLIKHEVLASIASLMKEADEELLHLTLESLCIIVKQCPRAVAAAEAAVTALVLEVWQRCAADPLAHLQVMDLVSCACGCDQQLHSSMEAKLLPVVKAGLMPGVDAHITAAVVELYGVLLKHAPAPLAPHLWEAIALVFEVVMRADESALMQNSCDILCMVVKKSPKQLSEANCISALLQCIERLLGPALDDDACLHVGQLAMLVLAEFGTLLNADLMKGLLKALVLRLVRAERPYLQQELVVVIARLMCQDCAGTVRALIDMELPGQTNGLGALLSTWLRIAKDLRAKRASSITVYALCRLHELSLQDQGLHNQQLGGMALGEQLLASIVASLEMQNERCERAREGERLCKVMAEEEEDEEDEDLDDEEVAGTGKLLSDLVDLDDFEELSEGDEDEGEPAANIGAGSDPYVKLEARKVAAEYLAANAACAAGQQKLAERLQAALQDVQAHPN